MQYNLVIYTQNMPSMRQQPCSVRQAPTAVSPVSLDFIAIAGRLNHDSHGRQCHITTQLSVIYDYSWYSTTQASGSQQYDIMRVES